MGSWTATDFDNSNLSLSIHAGKNSYAVREVDDAATVCGGAAATLAGPGHLENGDLFARVTLVCTPGGNTFHERFDIAFTYNAGDDTLTDYDGVTWTRVG